MKFDSEEYISQLESMVNIDSGFGCLDGISRLIDFFEERLRSLDFSTSRISGHGRYADCLIATNRESEKYDLLLVGHVDTAYEKGVIKTSPFRTDGVYAYGPGIADMKAGALALYHILKCAPKELLDSLSICVVINGDEEMFARFSEPILIEYASKSNHAFILESAFPDGSHCVLRKGRLRYQVEFNGISVHAGYIYETLNASAIIEMTKWIDALSSLANREKGTSFNVGIVNGGTAVNMVAEKATMQFEYRMWEVSEQRRIEETINHMISHPFTDGVSVRVLDYISKPPMQPTRRTLNFIRRASEALHAQGYEFTNRPRGGMSDANHLFMYTPVCLDGMGPRGELNTSDADYEYIIIDSVAECIEVNLALMQFIANSRTEKSESSKCLLYNN